MQKHDSQLLDKSGKQLIDFQKRKKIIKKEIICSPILGMCDLLGSTWQLIIVEQFHSLKPLYKS